MSNKTNLPQFDTYGNYSSGNYGAHALYFSIPGKGRIYFSYKTPVAFDGPNGLVVRENDWSTTTGKHLNAIDNGDKKTRVSSAEFERLFAEQTEAVPA